MIVVAESEGLALVTTASVYHPTLLVHYGKSTLSCREISSPSVFWIFDNFQYIFKINHKFTKHLKESCELGFDQYFFMKYFLKITFVKEISLK